MVTGMNHNAASFSRREDRPTVACRAGFWCLVGFACLPGHLPVAQAQFEDRTANLKELPEVPPGFAVQWVAREPLVRHPSSLGFHVAEEANRLVLTHAGQPVAEFVFRDDKVLRPYFANVHAPGGVKVTRNHPPVKSVDATDHDTMHPGLWLAFGDLNGVDFWRNKGRIEHVRFVRQPRIEDGRLTFSVEEKYVGPDGAEICRGRNDFALFPTRDGTVLLWSAELRRADGPLTFSPQHEMGLGFRMATPLIVKGGSGRITGSHGGGNEAGNWGRIGSWWNYSGTVGGRHAGILALASADNARPVWAHARDYGFLALNPTGPPPDAKDVPSIPFTVPKGEAWRAKFGLLLHARPAAEPLVLKTAAAFVSAALDAWQKTPASK
jgi:hypothetical protein